MARRSTASVSAPVTGPSGWRASCRSSDPSGAPAGVFPIRRTPCPPCWTVSVASWSMGGCVTWSPWPGSSSWISPATITFERLKESSTPRRMIGGACAPAPWRTEPIPGRWPGHPKWAECPGTEIKNPKPVSCRPRAFPFDLLWKIRISGTGLAGPIHRADQLREAKAQNCTKQKHKANAQSKTGRRCVLLAAFQQKSLKSVAGAITGQWAFSPAP